MKAKEIFDTCLNIFPFAPTSDLHDKSSHQQYRNLPDMIQRLNVSPNSIFKIISAPGSVPAYLISEKLFKSIRDTVLLLDNPDRVKELISLRDMPDSEFERLNK